MFLILFNALPFLARLGHSRIVIRVERREVIVTSNVCVPTLFLLILCVSVNNIRMCELKKIRDPCVKCYTSSKTLSKDCSMAIGLFKVGQVRSYKWTWITVGHLRSHKSADVFRLYREVPKKKNPRQKTPTFSLL